MTQPAEIDILSYEDAPMATAANAVVVFSIGDELSDGAKQADELSGGAITRVVGTKAYKATAGAVTKIAAPAGMAAEALYLVSLGETPNAAAAQKAGGALAAASGQSGMTIYGADTAAAQSEVMFALALRRYQFTEYKTENDTSGTGEIIFATNEAEDVARLSGPKAALAEGIYFTRDLVNEPANVLTTEDFAARLAAMGELGLEVEILGEEEMTELGMNALLEVGRASNDESKLVVMKWNGGGDEAPLAIVGKGVVFDTGGISLKPAGGMEEMTMDMGGAGVVSGLMRTLALRNAKANVVGIVGLVENMPGGDAQRPGDIVKSMKGDTIEVINTDAEGRLVLCDALWYTQERFKPCGIVDLATLTGAVIIALGHENTGVFSNDDDFCDAFLTAAKDTGEGAWRLPLGAGYDKQLKSRLADMKNVGGRPAGSVTAAQFLQRFIQDGTPWIHLDIAGTALLKSATDLAPAGATGWGVQALNRLIADKYEG